MSGLETERIYSQRIRQAREEISKAKVKKKRISGKTYDIKEQIAPKLKIESRAHNAPEPTQGPECRD